MYAIFGKEFFKSLFIWSIYESRVYFLSFIEVFDGPRVKDQTPSQIQEMLEVIYDRMQYFWWGPGLRPLVYSNNEIDGVCGVCEIEEMKMKRII